MDSSGGLTETTVSVASRRASRGEEEEEVVEVEDERARYVSDDETRCWRRRRAASFVLRGSNARALDRIMASSSCFAVAAGRARTHCGVTFVTTAGVFESSEWRSAADYFGSFGCPL